MKAKLRTGTSEQVSNGSASSYLAYAALRHVGGKQENEDNVFALASQLPNQTGADGDLPFGLFIVADGVSSSGSGALASAYAVKRVAGRLLERLYLPMLGGHEAGVMGGTVGDIMAEAVREANTELFAMAGNGNNPATTLTVALVLGRRLYAAHVGDSRIYLLDKAGELTQVTADHSMVARLVEMGQMSEADAASSQQRSSLYRAVGIAIEVEVEVYSNTLVDQQRLLLCSDGLWSAVEGEEIAAYLQAPPAEAAAALVAAALAAHVEDNVSTIVVALD